MKAKRFNLAVWGLLISLILLAGGGILSPGPANAEGTVTIGLDPAICTVALNQTFTVDIKVTTSENVAGAQAYLTFDPTQLEVKSITKGSAISSWMEFKASGWDNFWDNTNGKILYSVAAIPSPVMNETFVVGTIEFKALAVTNSTPVNFITEGAIKTKVSYGGVSVLDEVQNGAVTIQPLGILNGHVDLEWRFDPPPYYTWATPLTVKFFFPNGTIARTENVTTDDWGNFTIANVASGTYNIGVKCPRSLSELVMGKSFSVASITEVNFDTLREGDANNDDVITGADYSQLCGDYNENSGPALDRCDFDRSGIVGSYDLGALLKNFNQVGDMYGMIGE